MAQPILTKKWIAYHKMKKMKEIGMSITEIAKETNHSRSTIYKYLSMEKDDFLDFLESQTTRKKKLEDFEDLVFKMIKDHTTTREIYEYFVINFPDINIVEQTMINFVNFVKTKYCLD